MRKRWLLLGTLALSCSSGDSAPTAESTECTGPIPGNAFSQEAIARLESVHLEWTEAALALPELPPDEANDAEVAAARAQYEEQRPRVLALEARFREACMAIEGVVRVEARRFARMHEEPVSGWAHDAATNFLLACLDRLNDIDDTLQARSTRFLSMMERSRARFANPCVAPEPMNEDEAERFLRAIDG